jgi:hypothetical protein
MRNITGIAISIILIFILTSGSAYAGVASKTTVYVENKDDDSQWVKFYLDGSFMKSLVVYQKTTRYVGYYQLSEGPHELKVEWRDPDTCEWREKLEKIDATGETTTTTITIPASNASTCKKAEVVKTTSYGSLDVSVRNADDDNLFIMLFVDGVRKKERTVGPGTTTQFIKISSLTPGTHTIRIRWKEPDTNKWYEKTKETDVAEGDNNITLETDELIYTHEFAKPTSSIDIYIKNVDDDDLWVDVYVDSGFASRYIKSDTKRHLRLFDELYHGKHTVRMRWLDPDLARWQERGFVINLDADEEVIRTFHTIKNTR